MLKISPPKKILFFGGGHVFLYILNYANKIKIPITVFTEKRHLKEKIFNKSFYDILKKNKIKFFVSSKIPKKKLINEHKENAIGLSYKYGFIFDDEIIKKFRYRLFNIHSQVLPNFRGKGGLTWNIISNSKLIGSSLHFVSSKIDRGKIILVKKKTIKDFVKNYDFLEKQVKLMDVKLIKDFIYKINYKKKFQNIRLNYDESFYWPSLNTKKNGWINFSWSTEEICQFINSFSGKYLGAQTYLRNQIIRLKNAKKNNLKFKFHSFLAGLVFRIKGKYIFVACRDGSFKCEYTLKKQSKIKLGSRLSTPSQKLENSLIHV